MDNFDDDPFVPIVVSKIGEKIRPNNCGMSDSDPFYKTQKHLYCDGDAVIKRVSKTHQAICCPGCCMRRFFPLWVKTYGELREYFVEKMKLNEARNARRRAAARRDRLAARRQKPRGAKIALSHKRAKTRAKKKTA